MSEKTDFIYAYVPISGASTISTSLGTPTITADALTPDTPPSPKITQTEYITPHLPDLERLLFEHRSHDIHVHLGGLFFQVFCESCSSTLLFRHVLVRNSPGQIPNMPEPKP